MTIPNAGSCTRLLTPSFSLYRFVVSRTSGQIILRGRLYLPLLLERPGSPKRAGPSCDAAKLCLSSKNVSVTPQQPTASHALRSLSPNPPPAANPRGAVAGGTVGRACLSAWTSTPCWRRRRPLSSACPATRVGRARAGGPAGFGARRLLLGGDRRQHRF